MSIVLTHAYYLYEDAKERVIMKPYPPLGLLYISGYLNDHNVENHLYDSTFFSKNQQLQFIEAKQPKAVAIYTNLMTKINVIKLIKILKNDSKYGFPKLILGGPDITYNCKNYLNTGVDFLIIGEGEQTTLELHQAITANKDYSTISGIAYLENGNVKRTPPRVKMKDLSELPLPNRAAISIEKYLDIWKSNHGKSSMTVSTQRGCPYTCKWCSTAVYGQSYRRRPADLVAEELLMLKDTYNPDSIWFVDDVFTVSHKWLKSFHEEVIKQNAIIPFECITRAERLNDEILQLLKEAGCYRIWIGAESGSQKIIDAMDRRVDVDVVKEAIQKTNALGIETGTFIMVGYPGEDENDINETITYLKAANPSHFTITVAYPIKGTSLYNEIEDKITTQPNWETSTDRDIDFTRTYSRKFYDYAVRRIVNEVNYNKEVLKGSDKNLLISVKLKTKSILAQTGMKLHKR
ncbi:radical SAM protein [Winogradskyella sp.]|uniref:B12-binding domain-containing radical SAM protein n=1 Tax=Winogradskyella sp. TaxID=1883156 RepID=UPI0025D60631|nr:radical SAM protein [Winogradskyella sp.]